MNDGISFNEACEQNPGALTTEQAQNCPGYGQTIPQYVYVGVPVILVIFVLTLILVIRSKRSK